MGLFGFSELKRKADAYAVLQRYFSGYGPLHDVDIDPKRDSHDLVEQVCKEDPDILKFKLHRVSIASGALALALHNCYEAGAYREANFFLYCLGQLLMDVEQDASSLKFTEYDGRAIRGCSEMYREYAEKLGA